MIPIEYTAKEHEIFLACQKLRPECVMELRQRHYRGDNRPVPTVWRATGAGVLMEVACHIAHEREAFKCGEDYGGGGDKDKLLLALREARVFGLHTPETAWVTKLAAEQGIKLSPVHHPFAPGDEVEWDGLLGRERGIIEALVPYCNSPGLRANRTYSEKGVTGYATVYQHVCRPFLKAQQDPYKNSREGTPEFREWAAQQDAAHASRIAQASQSLNAPLGSRARYQR